MAFKEREESKAARVRSGPLQRRQFRERQDRQEGELWTGDLLCGLARVRSPISDDLDVNSRDAERLRRSRQQISEGKIHWGVEDDEGPAESHAGV